ncbi:Zinc finger MYND domain-containing protein 10 [Elasticomyces elasticus]|nr:Zinc finger MYND domain-containing protein 10 [Elasticomyces elasticus]KAK3640272.1 Zinc finger MYND domain-containing protein 10 [Elasticomyces elasticus]KAK4920549.1 Zinc finger MYND domain-containing protein 10 [Elasticomyces elasticus]KAK5758951.1 Zinc finger MYND domain-containing protein 10 [Elasticomyces elasticus]
MATNASANSVRQVCNVCGNADGVLFKCSRCKLNHYCSKACQAENWTMHKIYCNKLANGTPKNTRHGALPPGLTEENVKWPAVSILIVYAASPPPGYNEIDISYAGSFMANSTPTSPRFVDSPVASAIGYPLGVMERLDTQLSMQVPNTWAANLFLDIDPKSAGFGTPTEIPTGGVMLCRRDGRHVRMMEIAAVIDYLGAMEKELRKVRECESNGEDVDRGGVVQALFTGTAFAAGFEDMKQMHLNAGRLGWDFECPVKVAGVEKGEKQEGTA